MTIDIVTVDKDATTVTVVTSSATDVYKDATFVFYSFLTTPDASKTHKIGQTETSHAFSHT